MMKQEKKRGKTAGDPIARERRRLLEAAIKSSKCRLRPGRLSSGFRKVASPEWRVWADHVEEYGTSCPNLADIAAAIRRSGNVWVAKGKTFEDEDTWTLEHCWWEDTAESGPMLRTTRIGITLETF